MQRLHVHCGDCSAEALRRSGIAGEILVWREIYTEGPVPGNLPDPAWRRLRAEFLSGFGIPFEELLRNTEERYARLERAAREDGEVILWFDACLFDQTILSHILERLARLTAGCLPRLSLVCVSDRGLGEVPAVEMAALFEARAALSREHLVLAAAAWEAFTSADPRDIERFLDGDSSLLPHLGPALRRHLEQFPSLRNGLNRLQNEVLAAVAGGEDRLGGIFRAVSAREEQPFFGDTSLWACLDELARGRAPLLTVVGPGPIVRPVHEPLEGIERWRVGITEAGGEVLAGAADRIRLNGGIDRWLGGVHLCGRESPWRWDGESSRLARPAASV
ncbi:MAG: DUF1835 domain-containing protein [Lentisphaeria bacterium]|nr:DUF1835 domain-containing protein [Lentisphaeria bacterium]